MAWCGNRMFCWCSWCCSIIGLVVSVTAFVFFYWGMHYDFKIENAQRAVLQAPRDAEHCGWGIFIPESADCAATAASLNVTKPPGSPPELSPLRDLCWFTNQTKIQVAGEWLIMSFQLSVEEARTGEYFPGTYVLESGMTNFWVVDWCGQWDDHFPLSTDFFMGWIILGLIVLAILIWTFVWCLCCLTYCCCWEEDSHESGRTSKSSDHVLVGKFVMTKRKDTE